jgi:hypothetical protein
VGALVLHPAYKWQYIEEHWLREWWGPAKAALQGLWESKYAPTGLDRLLVQASSYASPQESTSTNIGTTNMFTEWKNSLKAKVPTTTY